MMRSENFRESLKFMLLDFNYPLLKASFKIHVYTKYSCVSVYLWVVGGKKFMLHFLNSSEYIIKFGRSYSKAKIVISLI